jgi:aldehyde:ferredoxin oxidoreductase
MGKILRVNLSRRTFQEESTPPELAQNYIGGKGELQVR